MLSNDFMGSVPLPLGSRDQATFSISFQVTVKRRLARCDFSGFEVGLGAGLVPVEYLEPCCCLGWRAAALPRHRGTLSSLYIEATRRDRPPAAPDRDDVASPPPAMEVLVLSFKSGRNRGFACSCRRTASAIIGNFSSFVFRSELRVSRP